MHISKSSSGAVTVQLADLADCREFAESLAASIQIPLCIGLIGTLGAGKTQWTRFFATALGATHSEISSPTFVLLQQYSSNPVIYHLDAYRIRDEDELLETGIEEILDREAVTLIEWADRFENFLPTNHIALTWELDAGSNQRTVRIRASGPRGHAVLTDWLVQLER